MCVGITNGPSCQVRTLHSQRHFTACQAAHTGLLSQTPRVAGKAPPSLPQGRAPHKPRQAIFKETILNCQRGCSRAPGLLGGLGLRFVFGAVSSPYTLQWRESLGAALSSSYITTHLLVMAALSQIPEVRVWGGGWEKAVALGSLSLPPITQSGPTDHPKPVFVSTCLPCPPLIPLPLPQSPGL